MIIFLCTRLSHSSANKSLTNSPYTTNRILEIPQDIKLELNNGTLTLKAGSKMYVPNGFESDGTTPKFDVYTTTSDVSLLIPDTITTSHLLFWTPSTNTFNYRVVTSSYSGTTDTGSGTTFYNTSTNIITSHNNGGDVQVSLPIALFTKTSIDQVFNGFGYIGSTFFALPGVKVQAPNGKDSNRRYLNRELNVTQVTCRTVASNVTRGCIWFFLYDDNGISFVDSFGYDSEHNYSLSVTTPFSGMALCTASATNGVLSNFKPYQVDSVANSNMSNISSAGRSFISGMGMPSGTYIELTLGSSDATYTAPANGYFNLYVYSGSGVAYAKLANTSKGNISASSASYVPNSNPIAVALLPVSKGDTIKVGYTATVVYYFRFYYAEGEN